MPGLPAALVKHRARLDEIAEVLAKYGFAACVQRGSPHIVAMSDGEWLRRNALL